MRAISSLIAAWLLASVACIAQAHTDETLGVHVTGRAEVMAEPDMAHITFEIVRQGEDAAALTQDVEGVTARVVELAESLGVASEDLATAVIQVTPDYRMSAGRAVLEGVTVRRTVRVELRSLARYNELIEGALKAGVNSLANVELDVRDRDALERRALSAAIEDALREAAFAAERLGLRLGRVLDVQVQDAGLPVRPLMMAERAASDAAFRPGQIAVERAVNLLLEIGPTAAASPPRSDSADPAP